MPRAAEGVILSGETHAYPHTPIGGDNLEDDIKSWESHRVMVVVGWLRDRDKQDRDSNQPNVVTELGTDLLANEVTAGGFIGWPWDIGASQEMLTDQSHKQLTGSGARGFLVVCVVVGVDT